MAHVEIQVTRNGFIARLMTPRHADGDQVVDPSVESLVFTSKTALWNELQSHFDRISTLEQA